MAEETARQTAREQADQAAVEFKKLSDDVDGQVSALAARFAAQMSGVPPEPVFPYPGIESVNVRRLAGLRRGLEWRKSEPLAHVWTIHRARMSSTKHVEPQGTTHYYYFRILAVDTAGHYRMLSCLDDEQHLLHPGSIPGPLTLNDPRPGGLAVPQWSLASEIIHFLVSANTPLLASPAPFPDAQDALSGERMFEARGVRSLPQLLESWMAETLALAGR